MPRSSRRRSRWPRRWRIRAVTDGFDVDLGCGGRRERPVGREALLDETCAWALARVALRRSTCWRGPRTSPGRARPSGSQVVVSGSSVRPGAAAGGCVRVRRRGTADRRTRRPGQRRRRAGLARRCACWRSPAGAAPAAGGVGVGVNPSAAPAGHRNRPGRRRCAVGSGLARAGRRATPPGPTWSPGWSPSSPVTGWALLCTVQRYPAGVFLLVSRSAFPVLGATAALHNYDLLGFPAPGDAGPAHGDAHRARASSSPRSRRSTPGRRAGDPVRGGVRALRSGVLWRRCGPAAAAAPRARAGHGDLRSSSDTDQLLRAALLGPVRRRGCSRLGLAASRPAERRGLARARGRWPERPSWGPAARSVPSCFLDGAAGSAPQAAVLRGRVGRARTSASSTTRWRRFRKYTRSREARADNLADKRLLRVRASRRDAAALRRARRVRRHAVDRRATGRSTTTTRRLFQRIGTRSGPALRAAGAGGGRGEACLDEQLTAR